MCGISPSDFFNLEPIECFPIIRGYKAKMKFENYSSYVSTLNAVGGLLSKKYKYKDIFEENKEKRVTQEEKDELFEALENL